jgi:hypothetical protein
MTTRKRPTRENKRYWLSYDLGLRGNYDSLYEWLDEHSASECGDSLATFKSNQTSDELREELIDLLGETGKVRVYLIAAGTGSFLIGKRKAAPWAGSFQRAVDNVLDQ